MRRGLLGAPAALLLAVLLALTSLVALVPLAAPAAAAPAADGGPRPGHPWFGPSLDIHTDSPSAYAARLGATPSLYTFPADLPLTEAGVDQLHRFSTEVAQQGAVLVLQLEPTVPLDEISSADDAAVAELVAGLAQDLGLRTLVRFAPEMNGSWHPWGQQPQRYVTAFRQLAGAVHEGAPAAAMVWSPVYGSGYPFRERSGADSEIDLSGSRQVAPLDTDGNGRLDDGDDPYGPYYPGDDAVDWAGLFLYRFGQSQGVRRNVVPPAGEVEERLAERWGYPRTGQASFYDRFSARTGHPMLLETAALHNPAVGGASALEVERRWWREVLRALPTHPLIGAVSWLELSREEPEVADRPVSWGITSTPGIAQAFHRDLLDSPVTLGPVSEPRPTAPDRRPTGSPTAADLEPVIAGPGASDGAKRVAAVLVVLLLGAAVAGARRRSWAFSAPDERDRRIDLLRGLLLVAMVALHLPVTGALHDLASGALSLGGLESFVVVSGVCVGLVYPPLAERLGHTAAAGRRFRRAFVIWIGAVAAVLGTYVLALLPGLDLADIGTVGPPGDRVDLYAGARHLFDYPPPGWIAQDLLALRLGSWLLLPLGLLVALQLLSPLAAGPVARGWWAVPLASSWALYALGRWSGAESLPSYSEAIAPLLVWQVLFVHGIVLGRHRDAVGGFLRRPLGVAVLAVVSLAAAVALGTGRAPDGSTASLPLLRLLVVGTAVLLALAVLTTCWRPVAAATAPVLLPLGRAPLLVVLAQPVLVLVVARVDRGLPDGGAAWTGPALTVAAIALLVLTTAWLERRRRPRAAIG